jgi:hypothetical protein
LQCGSPWPYGRDSNRRAGDAANYQAFEASIIADYDAQSTVERELVLRLASLLWRLRRATTMETGLFDIQAEHLRGYRQTHQLLPHSQDVIHAVFGRADLDNNDSHVAASNQADKMPGGGIQSDGPAIEFARCHPECQTVSVIGTLRKWVEVRFESVIRSLRKGRGDRISSTPDPIRTLARSQNL